MATTIKLKRGSGAPASLVEGELAMDTTNNRLYRGPSGGGAGVELLDPILKNARLAMTRQAVSTASATLSINANSGWHVSLSLGHTVTSFSITNVPASGTLCKITLDIANTGAFNISSWPGTVKWVGSAPTITSGSGKLDTIVLTTVDGGTNWRGYKAAQDMV